MPHETHAPPGAPHALADVGRTQMVPEQQPVAQVVALQPAQTPAAQLWPLGHAWHCAPPAPHVPGSLPAWHTLP
jgi:hypothetical protein